MFNFIKNHKFFSSLRLRSATKFENGVRSVDRDVDRVYNNLVEAVKLHKIIIQLSSLASEKKNGSIIHGWKFCLKKINKFN